jgi:tetratricopeptide (TPR) repeat protein
VSNHKLADCQIRDIAIQADGHRVVFATQFGVKEPTPNGAIGVWDVASSAPPQLGHHGPAHTGLALLPDGAIATSDTDGIARIWRPLPALAAARSVVAAAMKMEEGAKSSAAMARAATAKKREALPEYGKVLAERPDDAALLIERGRLLAEIGEASLADADFTRAAQLAPDNPQLFLNGGWWVAGAYPPDLKIGDPIESERAPDPSKPPPPSAGAPRRWQSVPIEMLGRIDLGKVYHSDNVAAYALSFVYASARKDVILLIATDDAARVWLNGRLVLESPGYTALPDGHAVLGTLQSGRNTLLAKVANRAGPHSLQLRISESPAAFSRAFAQAKKWDLAIEAYNKVMALEPDNRDLLLHDAAGIAFAQSGQWKNAKEAFERGLAIDPNADWIQRKLLRLQDPARKRLR